MARRTRGQGRFSSRQKTWLWIIIATSIVVVLLYWEQIALLYVLVTLSMTLLLAIVAFSDLTGAHTVAGVAAAGNEAPANEVTPKEVRPAPQSTFGARPRKRRR